MNVIRVKHVIFILATLVMFPYTNCSNVNVAFDSNGQPILGGSHYDTIPGNPPVQMPDPGSGSGVLPPGDSASDSNRQPDSNPQPGSEQQSGSDQQTGSNQQAGSDQQSGSNQQQNSNPPPNSDQQSDSSQQSNSNPPSQNAGQGSENSTPLTTADEVRGLDEAPRPVGDLKDDPSLYETYSCNSGKGVMVCHLSHESNHLASLCVGRSAALAHARHVRTVSVGGETQQLSDYLGPCRE